MRKSLNNRMASGLDNRGNKHTGRPPDKDKQPEKPRLIIHKDTKVTVENCPHCGATVVMRVYSVSGPVRYATCPECESRLALKEKTARKLIS